MSRCESRDAGRREPTVGHADDSRLVGRREASNEPALPRCLHGAGRIVPADVVDRRRVGHSVEYGEAGKRCAGAPDASPTGDLDAIRLCARPHFAQRSRRLAAIGRQPEIGPAKPAMFPFDGRRAAAQQIQRKGGMGSGRNRAPQPPSAHASTRRKFQHSGRAGLPRIGHRTTITRVVSGIPVGESIRRAWFTDQGTVVSISWSLAARFFRGRDPTRCERGVPA